MRKLRELMDLSGRVALVTGGAGFIGRAICQALSENGCELVVMDRVSERAEMQQLMDEADIDISYVEVDLENETSVRAAVSEIVKKHHRLDVLINNAAYVATNSLEGWATNFSNQNIGTWRRALEVNLTSCMVICQSAASALAANGGGSIINVGSIYGSFGPDWSLYEGTSMGNPAAYAASKGGLIQLSRWLATTLAPHVRVNSVSPGGVARGQPQDFVSRYEAKTPLGRMATEEDLKGIIALLSSDASAYITGQDILVDGGWSAW